MLVSWYGIDDATYDVERSDDNGRTWTLIANDIPEDYMIDDEGTSLSFYRVRTHDNEIWNPMFKGEACNPPKCRLFGHIRDLEGAPFGNTSVYIKVPSKRQFLVDAFYVTEEQSAVITDNNGYWFIELPRGLAVNIRIPIAKINETVIIPDQPSADLAALL